MEQMIKEGYWKGYYSGCRLLPPKEGDDEDEQKYEDYIQTIQIDPFFPPSAYAHLKPEQTIKSIGQYCGKQLPFQTEVKIRTGIDDQFNILFKINQGEPRYMKGKLEGNVITGVWAKNEEDIATKDHYGQGKFEIEYVQPKKGWNGCFVQNGIEYNMSFDHLTIGHLSDKAVEEKGSSKVISGQGRDRKGQEFKIQGTYNPDDSSVEFVKTYKGHSVAYKGELKDKEVIGKYKGKHPFRLYYI